MQPKTERFELRFDQDTLQKLDSWRGQQDDVPTRAEAVRRLINRAIDFESDRNIHFSHGERLVLHLLCDIHRKLDVVDGVDAGLVSSALLGGHHWALKWKYGGTLLPEHEDDPHDATHVANILDMWTFIESGHGQLSAKDQKRVAKETGRKTVEFSGFDGNNESRYYAIARFFIDDMDRFTNFAGRSLNSHFPKAGTYLRMLQDFEPMRATLVGKGLSVSQIIELLNAANPKNGTKDNSK